MAERALITRRMLQRELALNAATTPLALAVGATVAVAALVLGVGWLLLAAVLLYLAIALTTFFDEDEAERVGRATYERRREGAREARALPRGLAPEIASLVERARAEEARIESAIAASAVSFDEIAVEVDYLMSEVERIAARAQTIWEYLQQQRPFEARRRLQALRGEASGGDEIQRARERAVRALEHQIGVADSLQGELNRFEAEMEHFIASLGVIHGELVRMSVSEDVAAQGRVAGEVRELRGRVGAVSRGIREAVEQLEDDQQ